ncbi:hypothetical protein IW140_001765 [Coemansia sp. RSA 1813]|nr:hypothetical protein EV178_002978 [Coemansia sp. RSA 1646]KAJ2213192.1 hypothetical protein EV179_004067 [Coemansia sp. RSA 487]KAJ2571310.1 hypothetical protein IW140_001765 [Coemansia sp. RSA 1813]
MLNRGILLRGSHARITDDSVMAKCPRCRNKVMTVVMRKISAKNIAATATVTVVGIMANAFATLVPLALAALDLSPLKNKIHYCAYCNYEFGKHVTVSIPKPSNSQLNSELNASYSTRYGKHY